MALVPWERVARDRGLGGCSAPQAREVEDSGLKRLSGDACRRWSSALRPPGHTGAKSAGRGLQCGCSLGSATEGVGQLGRVPRCVACTPVRKSALQPAPPAATPPSREGGERLGGRAACARTPGRVGSERCLAVDRVCACRPFWHALAHEQLGRAGRGACPRLDTGDIRKWRTTAIPWVSTWGPHDLASLSGMAHRCVCHALVTW